MSGAFAFTNAWMILKSRTLRNQEGWPPIEGHEPASGAANQPFTDVNLRQRVPLVGAQRVDENFAERSDSTQPRRGQEQGTMMRDMGADKDAGVSFDEEEGVDEFSEHNDYKNSNEINRLLGNIRTRQIDTPPVPSPEQLRSTSHHPPPQHSTALENPRLKPAGDYRGYFNFDEDRKFN